MSAKCLRCGAGNELIEGRATLNGEARMSDLDLDDVVATSQAAKEELARLRAENADFLAKLEFEQAWRTVAVKTLGVLRERVERLEKAVGSAYGYLWHVDNSPENPRPLSSEKLAHQARHFLRDVLTHEQRGQYINEAQAALAGEG